MNLYTYKLKKNLTNFEKNNQKIWRNSFEYFLSGICLTSNGPGGTASPARSISPVTFYSSSGHIGHLSPNSPRSPTGHQSPSGHQSPNGRQSPNNPQEPELRTPPRKQGVFVKTHLPIQHAMRYYIKGQNLNIKWVKKEQINTWTNGWMYI